MREIQRNKNQAVTNFIPEESARLGTATEIHRYKYSKAFGGPMKQDYHKIVLNGLASTLTTSGQDQPKDNRYHSTKGPANIGKELPSMRPTTTDHLYLTAQAVGITDRSLKQHIKPSRYQVLSKLQESIYQGDFSSRGQRPTVFTQIESNLRHKS